MLFTPQLTRYPDLYPWANEFVKAMRDGFWTVDKFSFESDIVDFATKLSPEEREVIIRVLACIAQVEVKVKRFWLRLGDVLDHPSIISLGIKMADVEDIHDKAYARLTEVLGAQAIFDELMKVPAISDRVKYLDKYNKKVYTDSKRQFIYSLILFTMFVENVSLFSQFYVVLLLNREDGVLKDTAQQVKYTRNEELIHAQAGMMIIRELRKEYPELFDDELEARIYEECTEALKAEYRLIDFILGDYARPGLSQEILRNFINERINNSLVDIGYKAPFEVDPKLSAETEWMERGAYTPVKFDFFHGENTEYIMEDIARSDNFNIAELLTQISNFADRK
jgi:ribonucleoside-diphosphate reductase beta chain